MSDEKHFKGTTTVGIVFDKGVVVAADKRATMGSFIASKDVEKVLQVSDSIVVTTAGGVGDAQSLVRLMRAELELYKHSRGSDMTVKGAATLLANVLQGNKYYPFLVQIIVAGFDQAPHLYDVDLLGGLLEEKYTSTGSGSVVAYGILDAGYKNNLKEEEAITLALKAVRSAIKRDSATGEGVDVIVVSKDKFKRLKESEMPANAS